MAQIIADGEREEFLAAMGFVTLRLRWAQVTYEPERTLSRIEEHVSGSHRGARPEPRAPCELRSVDKSRA